MSQHGKIGALALVAQACPLSAVVFALLKELIRRGSDNPGRRGALG